VDRLAQQLLSDGHDLGAVAEEAEAVAEEERP
jgi:hypothetical protein